MHNNRNTAGDRIYLAAPLFNDQERSFNCLLASVLESSFSVYLPQRDGTLIPGQDLSESSFERAAAMVYMNDVFAMREADAILCVLDGRTIDEGVAFELGYAKALGKVCYGFYTDSRVLLPYGINPMISRSMDKMFYSLDELSRWVHLGKSAIETPGNATGPAGRCAGRKPATENQRREKKKSGRR